MATMKFQLTLEERQLCYIFNVILEQQIVELFGFLRSVGNVLSTELPDPGESIIFDVDSDQLINYFSQVGLRQVDSSCRINLEIEDSIKNQINVKLNELDPQLIENSDEIIELTRVKDYLINKEIFRENYSLEKSQTGRQFYKS